MSVVALEMNSAMATTRFSTVRECLCAQIGSAITTEEADLTSTDP